jgi:hypothetical protein
VKSTRPEVISRTLDKAQGCAYLQELSIEELFRVDGYPYLAFRIVNGLHVSKAQLQLARMANSEVAVPDLILEYEERVRRGEVKRPGRPAANLQHRFRVAMVRRDYPIVLRYLQRCRRRAANTLTAKEHPESPPHEVAAKIVRDRYLPYCDWRHVLNLAKEKRSGHFF